MCTHLLISGYFEGIVRNLEAMPVYYPGWVMRLYHDFDDDDPIAKVIWIYNNWSTSGFFTSVYMVYL